MGTDISFILVFTVDPPREVLFAALAENDRAAAVAVAVVVYWLLLSVMLMML